MASWTPKSKPATPTYTAGVKHTAAWTAATKPTVHATAGMYYGFGAFTYSGGQSLPGIGTSWTAATKH